MAGGKQTDRQVRTQGGTEWGVDHAARCHFDAGSSRRCFPQHIAARAIESSHDTSDGARLRTHRVFFLATPPGHHHRTTISSKDIYPAATKAC